MPNSGSWDMNTVNETGAHKGGTLHRLRNCNSGSMAARPADRETYTVWQSPAAGRAVAFDPSYWTPAGTFITGEESWGRSARPATHPSTAGCLNCGTRSTRASSIGHGFSKCRCRFCAPERGSTNVAKACSSIRPAIFTSSTSWGGEPLQVHLGGGLRKIMAGKADYFAAGPDLRAAGRQRQYAERHRRAPGCRSRPLPARQCLVRITITDATA